MPLLDICEQHPPVVTPEASVADAIQRMLDEHVGAIAVVDSEGVVAGIFTERDVLKRVSLSGRDPHTTPICEMMTTPVELGTEQTTEAEALSVMLERHYRHLPIVDTRGRLLGMLSIRHVLEARVNALVRELETEKAR